ncbi:MAG: hypothetical protein WCL57_06625 [Chloroflexota bacterium]|nr:hypothetical protein [Chloroflexota bacterium]
MSTSANISPIPSVGQLAPNFLLPSIEDQHVQLSASAKPAVLVFMRHLA